MPEFGRIDVDTVRMLSTACRENDMQAANENIKKQALLFTPPQGWSLQA